MKKPVALSLVLLTVASVAYLAYRALAGQDRYEALVGQAIARLSEEENPLCASLLGVEGFPYTAGLRRPPGSTLSETEDPPPPQDLISGQRWRDLVAAGLVTEAEHRGPDRLLSGYTYELTAKGRALYSERQLTRAEKAARFCLGQPELKRIVSIAAPVRRGDELELPARYVLQVPEPRPELSDGTAQALGLELPPAGKDGALLLPEIQAVFVLDAAGKQVLQVRRESL